MPPVKRGKGEGADDDDSETKDASAAIVELSMAVVSLSNIASRAEEDRLEIQDALGECKKHFPGHASLLAGTKQLIYDQDRSDRR